MLHRADDGLFVLPRHTRLGFVLLRLSRALSLDSLRRAMLHLRASPSALSLTSVACGTLALPAILASTGRLATLPWIASIIIVQCVAIAFTVAAWRASERRHAGMMQLTESDPATGCLNRRGFARAL